MQQETSHWKAAAASSEQRAVDAEAEAIEAAYKLRLGKQALGLNSRAQDLVERPAAGAAAQVSAGNASGDLMDEVQQLRADVAEAWAHCARMKAMATEAILQEQQLHEQLRDDEEE